MSIKSSKLGYDVITVGSATIDAFADTESELIKIMTKNGEEDLIAYPAGSKILIKELEFLSGGGGTNTGVALSRLGLKTGYLGRLGKDENGDKVLHLLKKENVDFIGTRGPRPTGYSIVLDSIEDDRTILTFKGANDYFNFDEIDKRKLKADWFYFCAMTGTAFKALCELAKVGKRNKIKIAFNPSSYLATKGKRFIEPILSRTDLLVLNKEEAEMIVGRDDIDNLMVDLHKLGPEIVVITDGKVGAYAYDSKTHSKWFIEALKVKVKETTGAGDAFASSFLAGLLMGSKDHSIKDIELALKLGVINSASVVMFSGAKEKLLTRREAFSRIRSTKFEIKHSHMT